MVSVTPAERVRESHIEILIHLCLGDGRRWRAAPRRAALRDSDRVWPAECGIPPGHGSAARSPTTQARQEC